MLVLLVEEEEVEEGEEGVEVEVGGARRAVQFFDSALQSGLREERKKGGNERIMIAVMN